MNLLINKLRESTVMAYILKVIFILVGIVVLSLFWVFDSIRQLFCLHMDTYVIDDEEIGCNRCGKEIETPWAGIY